MAIIVAHISAESILVVTATLNIVPHPSPLPPTAPLSGSQCMPGRLQGRLGGKEVLRTSLGLIRSSTMN